MTLVSPWHCLSCGSEAAWLSGSLDPDHPLGRCLGIHSRGAPVPITRDLDELDAALRSTVGPRARQLHASHVRKGRFAPRCRYCDAEAERAFGRRPHAAP